MWYNVDTFDKSYTYMTKKILSNIIFFCWVSSREVKAWHLGTHVDIEN